MPSGIAFYPARNILFFLWSGLCFLIVAAPLLLALGWPLPAAGIYLFFSPVCHQQPDRSYILLGYPLAVCHRCSGIYLGLLTGCAIPFSVWRIYCSPSRLRALALAGAVPLLLDALLPVSGIWNGTPISRFVTGLFFGAAASALAIPGLAEVFRYLSFSGFFFRTTNAKGGVS